MRQNPKSLPKKRNKVCKGGNIIIFVCIGRFFDIFRGNMYINCTTQEDDSTLMSDFNDKAVDDFLQKIYEYNKHAVVQIDINAIIFAVKFIINHHAEQKRYSGEPYYYHPVEVASITTDYYHETDVIIAALLHDVVEDTLVSLSHVRFIFGKKVSELVDIVTKVTMDYQLSKEETLHKINGLPNRDRKAITIKVIDRLHNMSTIDHIEPKEKRRRIALETLQFYVPLAKCLNMDDVEYKLNILALTVLNAD